MGRAKLAAIGGLGLAAVSGLAWAVKHFLKDRGYDDLDSKINLSGGVKKSILISNACMTFRVL